jgi:hypothetical protein
MARFKRTVVRGFNRFGLLSIALIACGGMLSAATYYINPSGSDSNSGSSSSPYRTIAKGVSVAGPGDTILLQDGTYGNEGHISDGTGGYYGYATPVYINKAGTSSAWITIKAQNKGKAILDCGTTSTSRGCDKYIVLGPGAAYWVFQDLMITRGAFGGIGTDDGASHIKIKGCVLYNIGNYSTSTAVGMDGIGFDVRATDWWIEGNVLHDIGRTGGTTNMNWDHGIYAEGTNITIINNIFYNLNKGWHIQVANGAYNWLIANNTFSGRASGAGQIMLWNSNTNMTFRNNIFYNPSGWALERYTSTLTNCVVDHNLVYGASSVMGDTSGCSLSANNVGGNPNFANPGSYDFHVKSGGAGIDTGTNSSSVTVDFDGVTRPQGSSTDMGAYEYSTGSNSPAPPTISGVYVSNITTGSAVINWTTDQPSTSWVSYGTGSSYSNSSPVNSTLLTIHSVTLTGLNASTTYHFQVGSANSTGQSSVSGDAAFTTSSAAVSVSLSASAPSLSITQAQSGTDKINATLLSGSAPTLTFSASGAPSGVSASFSPSSCTASCSTTLTLAASAAAAPGTYTITVNGAGGGASASTAISVTIVGSSTSSSSGDIKTGLVAQWKFTEGSGNYAYDSSGYGNTATLTNPTWWTSNYGVTAWFNGSSSQGVVKESSSLQLTTAATVAFWVRPSVSSATDPRIIAKLYDWDVKLNNRYPQFSAAGKYAMANVSLNPLEWHHVAFTFSKGVVTAYIDGVNVGMGANTFTGGETIAQYQYGLYLATDGSNPFTGSLDDVRVYNRALTAADVGALFKALPKQN